jgi:hypothetical protein
MYYADTLSTDNPSCMACTLFQRVSVHFRHLVHPASLIHQINQFVLSWGRRRTAWQRYSPAGQQFPVPRIGYEIGLGRTCSRGCGFGAPWQIGSLSCSISSLMISKVFDIDTIADLADLNTSWRCRLHGL